MVKERTGEPGMMHSIGSQRAGHDLATQQQKKTTILELSLAFNMASELPDWFCQITLLLTTVI